MNDENDHDYFVCYLKQNREKSYIVELKSTGKTFPVPKSLCELRGKGGPEQTLEVERWFADQEGMHE